MNKIILLTIYVLLLVGMFWAGMNWQEFQYDDICLDMGGGRYPGNHSICVIEKKVVKIPEKKTCANFIGSWVEPVPGHEKSHQGFVLYADGTAKSINMATLVYKKWESNGQNITLTAESIGNHTSSVDTDSFEYEMPTRDILLLKNRFVTQKFIRLSDLYP